MTSKPIPVAITKTTLNQLDKAANTMGTYRSRLILFAVQTLATYVEDRKSCTMPPDWREIFAHTFGGQKKSKSIR